MMRKDLDSLNFASKKRVMAKGKKNGESVLFGCKWIGGNRKWRKSSM